MAVRWPRPRHPKPIAGAVHARFALHDLPDVPSMTRLLLVTALFAYARAHMSLVVPISRNALDRADSSGRWSGGKWWPYQAHCAHPQGSTVPGTPGWNPQVPTGCYPNNTDGTPTDGWGCNCYNGTEPCDVAQSCLWFSNGCTIGCESCTGAPANPNTRDLCGSGMKPTVNAPWLRTYNRDAPAGSDADIYKHNPWRACVARLARPAGAMGGADG
jgi:hypothetical protein